MPEITTLSGLQGQVRKYIPGDWHELFSDPRTARKNILEWENVLADRVWQETISVGPYAFDGKPPWDRTMLLGDRLDMLLQVRLISSPSLKHEVRVNCQDGTCREHQFMAPVNLAVDLHRQVISEEVRDYYLREYGEERTDGTPVEIDIWPDATIEAVTSGSLVITSTLPESGMPVEWRLTTGQLSKRVNEYTRKHGISNQVSTAARLTKLGDLPPSQFLNHICNKTSEDEFYWLWDELERHEPGFDTNVEVECDECGSQFDTDSGVGNFILGTSRLTRRRRRIGSQATK